MKKLFLFALIALGISANAATKSEFFYQTEAGHNQLTPEFMYRSQNITYDATGTRKIDTTTTLFNLRYERGINDMLSAGVMLPYITQTAKEDTGSVAKTETKGLGDITLFLKGNYALAEGQTLWFGLNLNVSPGKMTSKMKAGGKTENNYYSGGHSIAPYVGYSTLVSSWVVGAKLTTLVYLGDRSLDQTSTTGTVTNYKLGDGKTAALTVFGETPITNGNAGVKLTYTGVNTTLDKANNSTTRFSGYSTLGLGAYGNYDFSEGASLVAGLEYTKVTSSTYRTVGTTTSGKVDSTSDIGIQLAGRFTF